MKTVLIYNAPDIFIRDLVVNCLTENGIQSFGPDTSINILYPNTPNLYFSGVSAVMDGYRIFVFESDAKEAKKLIEQLEFEHKINLKLKLSTSDGDLNLKSKSIPNFQQFYFWSLLATFIPIVPVIFGIYYFLKSLKEGSSIVKFKIIISLIILFSNCILSYIFIKNLLL